MSPGLSALLWFGFVLALIPLALWLLRRTPMVGGRAQGLRQVQVMPLSASQRIVTVEVGQGDERRWLVLGVTPQSITTLHTLSGAPAPQPAAEGAEPGAAPASFSQWLARMRAGGEGTHAR
jgi:flagellar protein FliO/FliZ